MPSLCSKIAYIAKAYYGYERRNTSALTSNYLNESPSYYNQESLWVSLILKNKSLSNSIRLQLERYYFKLSYITLLKDCLINNYGMKDSNRMRIYWIMAQVLEER